MKRSLLLQTLETKALALLLPPLRAAHGLTERLFLKTQARLRSKLRPVAPEARWRHLMEPLPVELSYAQPQAHAVCEIREPVAPVGDLSDYDWYRQVMNMFGAPVPEVEPPRELSPVPDSVLGCRFSFKRPEVFDQMREIDRSPFEIELDESN